MDENKIITNKFLNYSVEAAIWISQNQKTFWLTILFVTLSLFSLSLCLLYTIMKQEVYFYIKFYKIERRKRNY